MSSPAVTVENISKQFRIYHDRNQSLKATVLKRRRAEYEEFKALDDVSFEIPEGRTFGLMGRNGSGKSTLLKCIAGILTPNAGTITTRGSIAAMLEVGSGFHPELSGRENIYLNGSILGMSKQQIDRKLESIVEFSGVERFIDQPVKNYSSGMYVRLGFSVSIHTEPDILLVDEVLAVGDMDFQEKCRAKFAEFKASGRTVVIVSHSIPSMRQMCDDAAWLDQGVLQEVGPASAIIDRYKDSGHPTDAVAGGGQRHGTGELTFDRIELLNVRREPAGHIRTGESPGLRLHYTAHEPIARPNFKASITTIEGQTLWAVSGKQAEWVPENIPAGSSYVDVEIDRMVLSPGEYAVNAEAWSGSNSVPLDSLKGSMRFAVHMGEPRAIEGLVAMGSTFSGPSPLA
ncbi:ABC transporter ATP-binding protein [Humidisolicoccus flavus]|uniref:ABC transporter ATP-binding protein n=1 Tax=Humidisolicoccus flavus TaxID=3111414 RepID=UPI00324A6774